jgi:hypothetical protein
MGEIPDWYETIRAAKYLRVAPWDLLDQPVFWRNAALSAERAEIRHQEHIDRRNNQRGG